MTGYSLFLDESYDDSADVYVVGGVIIETSRVASLSAAVSQVTLDLVGDKHTELKYTEDPATKIMLSAHGLTIASAREAMASVPATLGGVTFVASIILDPTVDERAGSLQPLSWAFLRTLTHFTNFLDDTRASTDAGSHYITADRFPTKGHQTVFHDAYRRSFDRVPYGKSPRDSGLLDFITEADATHCPPLRLADHFAGTVRSWAMAERRYDANPGPLSGKNTGRTRHGLKRYLPYIRGMRFNPERKSGYGLSIWPEDRRPQLDLWLAHTRGRHVDEVYRAPATRVETVAGELVISLDPGSDRIWE